ncbi:zinc-binding alcohol dehydrogenase family protein, partial [Thermococcus sp.]|uniref:zinc-binding alcohol dehydrogenase family protein n=1 Tax=Thermococcus sp. TaxID=35749 RepID=UPI00260D2F68
MRAWVLKKQSKIEERPLKLVEVETPYPKDDEIRVKVLVCGVCRTDIHIAEGDLPLKKDNLILGHEIVGIVDKTGKGVKRFKVGDKVGVSWLNSTCGKCKFCLSGRENYCPNFKCTGWDVDGGYAEYTIIKEDFALNLNDIKLEAEDVAPLMCPGIAGYCAFKLTDIEKGEKLGLYGFGPTAYYVLKVANHLGIDTYVSTRSQKNIEAAKKAGAIWAADASKKDLPCKLDRSIVFPPAGNLVEPALEKLEVGGILVLAPVSMSTIEIKNYSQNLWGRDIRTLFNVKKSWGEEFLNIADEMQIKMGKEVFPFEKLQDALILVRKGEIKEPNAVIKI